MKKILLAVALAVSTIGANAQQTTELGYNLGFSNYLGDLQTNDASYKWPGIATGVFVRQSFNPYIAVKGFFNYGRIHGEDINTLSQDQINRNLSFRSFIVEYGATVEINLLPVNKYHPDNRSYKRYYRATPYLFGGLNIFHFNPKTLYNGTWISLQPLCTEGQGTFNGNQAQYGLTQIAIPFGFGFKYDLTKKVSVGLEFGFRKTFTDYLDDVSGNYVDLSQLAADRGVLAAALSYRGDELKGYENTSVTQGMQRGNNNNKDWYQINTLSISYKLYNKKRSGM